ncbi:SH3 domain-containing protein [Pustulibacterium marinum]|uniref:SH3 domain-containing protein n=2 Tax=Pustulibacterium marinum TaxID=1224947 RepID=A0A1I7HHK1_9FLAO|nr:SH3 domain-containing protein [Pustulibacterium marinum]
MMKKFIYIFLFLVSFVGFSQDNEALFRKATDLYNAKKYEDAISKYEQILKNGEDSANLYYNLANAHYKLSHIAPSIYYYEKALQLAPNDADIKNNITFAKNMTIDAIQPLPKTDWQKFKENTIGRYTYNGWAVIGVVCMFLFVIFVSVYFLVYKSLQKRIFFILAGIMLLLCIVTNIFAYIQFDVVHDSNFAIVYVPETNVKSEPNASADEIFMLHEGTKVELMNELNGWRKIKLADGKTGWLPEPDVKKL